MAYNKQQAHEYYENYTKKGRLKGRKGRKKGSKNKTEKVVGLYTAGLNDAGKMEVALLREEVNGNLKLALEGVTDPGKRKEIKRKFQYDALERLKAIKSNPSYVKEKSSKNKKPSAKTTNASKKEKKSETTKTAREQRAKNTTQSNSQSKEKGSQNTIMQMLKDATEAINLLDEKKDKMNEEQKAIAQQIIKQIINAIADFGNMNREQLDMALQGIKDGNFNRLG